METQFSQLEVRGHHGSGNLLEDCMLNTLPRENSGGPACDEIKNPDLIRANANIKDHPFI